MNVLIKQLDGNSFIMTVRWSVYTHSPMVLLMNSLWLKAQQALASVR
jgi:hypothetical protein